MTEHELRERLSIHLRAEGKSRAEVARSIGYSQPTLSQWLAGKYPSDGAEVARRVGEYLARESESRLTPPDPEWQPTSVALSIWEALRYCHIDGQMGIVCGPPGVGKTYTVQRYIAKNADCYLITADTHMSKARFLSVLIDTLHISKDTSPLHIIDDAVSGLRGSHRMIIIDEAQYLSHACTEILRTIHDRAGIGLALVGMPAALEGMVTNPRHAYGQILSRFGIRRYWRITYRATLDDWKIVAEAMAPGIDAATAKAIYPAARSEGGLRNCVQLLKMALRLAAVHGEQLCVDLVEDAKQAMLGEAEI